MITIAELADLLLASQEGLDRLKYTTLMYTLQRYHAAPKILTEQATKELPGTDIRRNVLGEDNGSARATAMYDDDVLAVVDGLHEVVVQWKKVTANFSFDQGEIDHNTDPVRILDLYKIRREQGQAALVKYLEAKFWADPPGDTDTLTPFGIFYWIVSKITGASATTGAGEFGGITPSGHANPSGGLTHAQWRNWTHSWTTFGEDDLIKKWARMHRKTNFIAPRPTQENYTEARDQQVYYTDEYTLEAAEKRARQQNDNHGPDLGMYFDEVIFKRHPVRWVPALDTKTNQQIVAVDWSTIEWCVKPGGFLVEGKPQPVANKHTVLAVFIDGEGNLVCRDRRQNGILIGPAI